MCVMVRVASVSTEPLPAAFRGLVDGAAIFPPGDAPLATAAADHAARRAEPYADLVGTFVVRDTDLPDLKATPLALSVVVTGGAGNIAGLASLSRKLHIAVESIEIALRDPDDLAGNARRVAAAVDAARSDGLLDDHVPVHVELPHAASTGSWLAAADEVAASEFRLKFRTGGLDAAAYPSSATLAGWIDAALDRETPFKCTAGLHRALRHTGEDGFEHHGFLNVLAATQQAFDGASRDDVVATLEERSFEALDSSGLDRGRRWFTSFGSCSVSEPLDDLITLGLLEMP
jgi:hypothetical protein